MSSLGTMMAARASGVGVVVVVVVAGLGMEREEEQKTGAAAREWRSREVRSETTRDAWGWGPVMAVSDDGAISLFSSVSPARWIRRTRL
jgi:hypothetical protein